MENKVPDWIEIENLPQFYKLECGCGKALPEEIGLYSCECGQNYDIRGASVRVKKEEQQ